MRKVKAIVSLFILSSALMLLSSCNLVQSKRLSFKKAKTSLGLLAENLASIQSPNIINGEKVLETELEDKVLLSQSSLKKKSRVKKKKLKWYKAKGRVEIVNNKELSPHYGFNLKLSKKISWSQVFKEKNIVKYYVNKKIIESEPLKKVEKNKEEEKFNYIAGLASHNKLEKIKEEKLNDQELVLYEYPQDKAKLSSVDEVKHRQSSTTVNSDLISKNKSNHIKSIIDKEIKLSMKNVKKLVTNQNPTSSLNGRRIFSRSLKNNDYSKSSQDYTLTTLEVREVELNRDSKSKLFGYQFIPEHDKNETYDSTSNGQLVFKNYLNGPQSLMKGTFLKKGLIRTKVDLPLDLGERSLVVPMFTLDSFGEFFDEKDIEGYGGHFLVDLNDEIDDVDLDAKYETRIFLDEGLNSVDEGENYSFILFLGIEPGNVLIRYLLKDGETAQRLGHITEDELVYDFAEINTSSIEKISINEKNTLGSLTKELDINEEQINIFNTDLSLSKQALGLYEIQSLKKINGSRTYLELSHLEDTLFIGIDNEKEIEVPSQDFIENILRVNDIESLTNQCVIQLNFKMPVKSFSVDGDTGIGPMAYESSYFDKDGLFTKDLTQLTEKAFLIGKEQGAFNLRVQYLNGSIDYFQTFCSPSTYLVEQL